MENIEGCCLRVLRVLKASIRQLQARSRCSCPHLLSFGSAERNSMFSEAQETQPDTLQSWEAPSAQQQVPGHSSRSRLAPALNDSSHRTAA